MRLSKDLVQDVLALISPSNFVLTLLATLASLKRWTALQFWW